MPRKIPNDMQAGTLYGTNNYGNLVIEDYLNSESVKVKFLKTGFTSFVAAGNIRKGRVKDLLLPYLCGVGFIGEGPHAPSQKGRKGTKEYTVWSGILTRCYSQNTRNKYLAYADCTVCEEWHNFQNFAAWYKANYPSDGKSYDLDKDIKVKGNKIYSPDTCLFVSHEVNTVAAKAKNYTYTSPAGEIVSVYNLKKFCRENGLHPSLMCEVNSGKRSHHKGWKSHPKLTK